MRVHFVRYTYAIKSYAEHLQQAGWLTAAQIAQTLHVHPTTAKKFAHAWILHAVRADDKCTILFEPPTGPLPTAQPGKRRDRQRYPQLPSDVRKGLQYEA